jgi:hypothetical protein
MGEINEMVNEAVERAHEGGRLNSIVAILVALIATCMAIGNVKGNNIALAMGRTSAKAVDTWSYYQAKSTKQNLAEATLDELVTMKSLAAGRTAGDEVIDQRIANYKQQVTRYEQEKTAIKGEAEGYERSYEALNLREDQFDLSEAAYSVAIALLGITALTRKRWLLGLAAVFMAVGLTFGLAGFLSWPLHSERLMGWLS